jgi:hypothetical protein
MVTCIDLISKCSVMNIAIDGDYPSMVDMETTRLPI